MSERISIRFYKAAPALQPYISTYHFLDIADGPEMADCLAPEWAVLRISRAGGFTGAMTGGQPWISPRVSLSGPLSRAMHLAGRHQRMIGIGIVPLGWAALIGVPAEPYADLLVDVAADPVLAHLLPLTRAVEAAPGDDAAIVSLLDAQLAAIAPPLVRDADRIVAINEALLDPAMSSAGNLADRVGLTPVQLARLATRAFGFTPQKLLRRQRFLRTLARVLLEPDLRWIETLDPAYYDQAQFSRDFREAMGMSPRDYLAMPHDLIRAAALGRAQAIGGPLQGLHKPA